MKLFNRSHKISKNYLIAASAYKRMVEQKDKFDFSIEALISQYEHETYGKPKPDASKNGYTQGKFILDITLAAIREEYSKGMFTKRELKQGSCVFVRRYIDNLFPSTLFTYR